MKQNKVSSNFEQNYTEAEKAQARQNIGLAEVAHSADYNDLIHKPSIPTVNNGTLTIQKNGMTVETFSADSSVNKTANIVVPTKTSDLTNDSGFITLSDVPDCNLYVAEYDVSTFEDLLAAFNAGKVIVLRGADFGSNVHTEMLMYDFNTTTGQTRKFRFAPTVVPRIASYTKYFAVLDETSGWSKDYFSNGIPTKTGGIYQLTADEVTHDLISHRGWLSNNIFNFDLKFFCSANACNIYLAYVDQPFTVDIVGTRRNVRNDLKAAIDTTTTVQSLVTSIDVWNRVVLDGESLNSASPRIDIATLGPQELSNFDYDVYWDLDIILNRLPDEAKPCYHLRIEKFGKSATGHSYLYATLTGSDLY